jgi:hypothetical protein
MDLNMLRRLRESVAASAEPQLQRGTANPRKDDELEESVSAASRKSAQDSGDTMADGKYPIRNQSEADKAWNLRNNGDADESSVVAHIRKQVKKHGLDMPGDKTRESETGAEHALGAFRLREAKVVKTKGGGYEATIICEGPGNDGDLNYYTKQALREAVQKGLFDGVQAYADHPSASEARDRPERSVRQLVGHFREAKFVDGNPAEVRAKFVPITGDGYGWVTSLIESALGSVPGKPLIGISIDGFGRTPDQQEINGRTYNMVREVTHLGSADIVTGAGAGGMFHRALHEAWRDPGSANWLPETSKEADMTLAQLQEKMKAGLGKLSEAAAVQDDDEKAGTLIEEGMITLRECASAHVEPETRIQEKRVEVKVPVAASGEAADKLAADLAAAQTSLREAEAARDTAIRERNAANDKIAANDTAKLASKVLREAKVPEKSARSWFDTVVAAGDEDAMRRLVEAKLAEREEILAEFRETAGVEGAGPRQPLREANGSTPATGGLLDRMGIDRDELAA